MMSIINPAAFPDGVLVELGRLTVDFAGLEDLLAGAIAALLSPGDQVLARDLAARMHFGQKREALRRLVEHRYATADTFLLADMKRALDACERAGTARNDLVHGYYDYERGAVFVARPGKKTREITLLNTAAVNAQVFEAWKLLASAFGALWNTTRGRFPGEGAPRTKKAAAASAKARTEKAKGKKKG